MNILGLGLPELLVIAFLLLVFFGKDKLPGLFRSLGSSVRELRESLKGTEDTDVASETKTEVSPHNDTDTRQNSNAS